MKTRILISILFFTSMVYSQTPSINQVNSLNNKSSYLKDVDIKKSIKRISKLRVEKDALITYASGSINSTKEKDTLEKKNKEIDIEIAKLIAPTKYQVENYIEHFDSIINKSVFEYEDLLQKQTQLIGNQIKMDSIGELINNKQKEIDNLKKDKGKKIRSLSHKVFWPSIRKKNRAYFFETMYNNDIKKTSFLNSFGISGNDNGIVGQSELLADNISAIRITFGTIIAASNDKEDTEEETNIESLDRLITGGGNFYLDLALPVATTIDKNNSDLFTAYAYLLLKAATDIKGYGNDIDTSTGNCGLGIYTYGSFASENKKFNFFIQANANFTLGSKEFYKNLLIDHNNGFFNGKIIAGLTLDNKYRFTANFLTFGSEQSLRREKISLGIQLLP